MEEVYNLERKGSLASPRLNIGALGCMTEHGPAYFGRDGGGGMWEDGDKEEFLQCSGR